MSQAAMARARPSARERDAEPNDEGHGAIVHGGHVTEGMRGETPPSPSPRERVRKRNASDVFSVADLPPLPKSKHARTSIVRIIHDDDDVPRRNRAEHAVHDNDNDDPPPRQTDHGMRGDYAGSRAGRVATVFAAMNPRRTRRVSGLSIARPAHGITKQQRLLPSTSTAGSRPHSWRIVDSAPATSSPARPSQESTEIVQLKAMVAHHKAEAAHHKAEAARHAAIAASTEKLIADLDRPLEQSAVRDYAARRTSL